MKEWRLRFLIVFSLLSIAGLILIQTYWIKDAIDIKENHFRQSVNQAISSAAFKLEKLAVSASSLKTDSSLKRQDIHKIRGDSALLSSLDSLMSTVLPDKPDTVFANLRQPHLVPARSKDTGTLSRHFPSDTLFPESSVKNGDHMGDESGLYYSIDSMLRNIGNASGDLGVYTLAKEQVEAEIEARASGDLTGIRTRFTDSLMILNLIAEELQTEGIRLSFRYALYLPFSGTMVFNHSAQQQKTLLKSGYVYSLFPSLKLSKPIYLMLYFPSEKQYLFAKQGLVLSMSFILIIILTWSFYFIVRNIYRQKKLGEMKTDFINNMTHEFKTPVSTISLACEALRDKDIEKSPVLYESYIKIIDDENKRLGKLAESILQTAVIDKGHLYLYFDSVDMHDLMNQIIAKYKPLADQRNGRISTRFRARNPVILGDKTHLYNMISNLMDNAIKYSGNHLEIGILTTDTDQQFIFSVQDAGIGISKANQKRIFDKLFRVPTGNVHDAKGFGLGLSYVKYILTRHSGDIRVESELHKGSTFTVTLPRNPANKA